MVSLPREVFAFQNTLERFVAIREVAVGLKGLGAYTPDTYSFPGEFGDLPHALLRRTNGGLQDEAWVNVEFGLARGRAGWLTLEFLAWWVRDLSRGGDQVQLRPMALPPRYGDQVQLGGTLKFILDQFVVCPGGDKAAALAMLQKRANSLAGEIEDYADVLGELVRPVESRLG